MHAFGSNDYMYYRETGLILSYLSYCNAESILGKENAHL